MSATPFGGSNGVTVGLADTSPCSVHVSAVPVQAPLQPENVLVLAGDAVSVTVASML